MGEPGFLRKSKPSLFLEEDQPLLKLLRDMFIETEAEYNVKELAPELGVSVFSVYKMFTAQVRLPAEVLIAIIQFVHERNAADTRLLDFICSHAGCMAVAKVNSRHDKALQGIMAQIAELVDKGVRE
jgi:hypothetical protein